MFSPRTVIEIHNTLNPKIIIIIIINTNTEAENVIFFIKDYTHTHTQAKEKNTFLLRVLRTTFTDILL